MFTIIQAKPQYLAEIYTMILELAQYEGIYDRIRITESQLANLLFCDKPNHFVAIALIDEKLVGLAMYNLTYHNICVNVNHGLYVENLYVSPMFHHQGIGTALLRHVAFVAKNSNASRLEWWVSKDNLDAQRFYEKIGAEALNNWSIYKGGKACIDRLLGDVI